MTPHERAAATVGLGCNLTGDAATELMEHIERAIVAAVTEAQARTCVDCAISVGDFTCTMCVEAIERERDELRKELHATVVSRSFFENLAEAHRARADRSHPIAISDIHGPTDFDVIDARARATAAERERDEWKKAATKDVKMLHAAQERIAELEAELDHSNSAINRAQFLVDEASYTDDGQAMYVDPSRVQELRESLDALPGAPAQPATPDGNRCAHGSEDCGICDNGGDT